MCGRFRQTRSQKQLEERFQAEGELDVAPRFNIAPPQPVLTVRQEINAPSRLLSSMRWGLIPSWAKDMSIRITTLNARYETVPPTCTVREAIRSRRSLIPADGFYE